MLQLNHEITACNFDFPISGDINKVFFVQITIRVTKLKANFKWMIPTNRSTTSCIGLIKAHGAVNLLRMWQT